MHRPRPLISTVLIALVAVALLAAHEGRAAGTAATASAAKTVRIEDFAFRPGTVAVSRGARVAFANSGGVAHTATGAGFDTKRIAPGKSATVRFEKRGTFAYHCKIHPFMKGRVLVE